MSILENMKLPYPLPFGLNLCITGFLNYFVLKFAFGSGDDPEVKLKHDFLWELGR
jgi:hypothetical protein